MPSKRPPVAPSAKPAMRVSWEALARAKAPEAKPVTPWMVPTPAPGVLPEGAGMAMDSAIGGLYDYAQQMSPYGAGVSFPGYPLLAELSLIAEYRRMALTLSQEMTREWGKIVSSGDDDKTLKIKLLEEAMDGFRLRDVFREAAEMDALFGKAHIYIDVGVSDDRDELATPLVASPRKIRKGSIRRIKTVEPIWTSPGTYNSSDPLADSFYRPQSWYVMGKEIHHTRLLTLISREVPDILKPAFFFGGVSLSALARPYIDGWHRTRKSVSDLLHSFTIWNLQTDMMATLSGGSGEDMAARAQLFNDMRDNRGLMMTDKEGEALENISVPLSTLDALQAQAQEQICSVDGFPIVVLLGLSPHGLNATAEPEMDVWRNRVRAQQEHLFNRPLKKIMDFIQLSEFGEIDDSLAWQWNDLKQQDGLQEANIRKIDADAAVELINAGVLSPEEIRQHLASQEDSPYSNIDVSDVPVPPEDPNADPFGMSAETEQEVPGAPSVVVPETQTAPPNPRPDAP